MRSMVAGALLWMAGGVAFAAGFDFDPYISLWSGSGDVQDVAVGDVNGDRLDDVVVGIGVDGQAAYDFSMQVFLQRSDGTLTAPARYPYGNGNSAKIKVALADLNGDGVSDMVACQAHGLTLYLTNGHGGFTRADKGLVAPADECIDVAFLDVDRDGHTDIASQSRAHGTGIYYGDGLGGIRSTAYFASSTSGTYSIDTGDVTGDGIADLVVVAADAVNVYPVKSGGGFGTGRSAPAPDVGRGIEGAAVADYNGDGRNDVAVAISANRPESAIWLYVQNASGALNAPSRLDSYDEPTALLATDLDRDGRKDLLLAHTGWYAIGRYLQGSSGLAPEATNPAVFNLWLNGLAAGDINDDGCTDAVIGGLTVLHGSGCHAIIARNDFDGDGRSDLLWRNSHSGANSIWLTGNSSTQQTVRAVTSQTWQVAGTGDFNGDGVSDLLWHERTTGSSVVWSSALSTRKRPLTTVTDLSWEIVGVGDFDGDRVDDILWRNKSTGSNAIWRSGNRDTQRSVAPVADPAWLVAGVDDFNGDGHDDILWHNTASGANSIWLSALSTSKKAMATVTDLEWKIVGTGDFNGDGQADVLWRHSTKGFNSIWRSADSKKGTSVPTLTDAHWVVAAVGDYNGNRKADIAWRNTATGADMIWRAAVSSVQWPAADVTNLAWRIVP